MLNLLAGGILFLISAYIGLAVKRHFEKRRDFFKDAVEFVDTLTDEVSFLKTPLPQIIQRFGVDKKGDFRDALLTYAEHIGSGKSTEFQPLSQALKLSRLTDGERDIMLSFLAGLGKTDAKTQLAALKNYRARLESFREESQKKFKTTGLLAYKLGILVGIAIMIIVA